jgi:hypothetical protein
MKTQRECNASVVIDRETLIWTRGRSFPLSNLDSRMKCIRCGSWRVMIALQPPARPDRRGRNPKTNFIVATFEPKLKEPLARKCQRSRPRRY